MKNEQTKDAARAQAQLTAILDSKDKLGIRAVLETLSFCFDRLQASK